MQSCIKESRRKRAPCAKRPEVSLGGQIVREHGTGNIGHNAVKGGSGEDVPFSLLSVEDSTI